jgi:osmotically-inducible protein OsmY
MTDPESDSFGMPVASTLTSDGISQRGAQSELLSDERLQRKVFERLTAAPDVDSSEITITVRNRDVTLEGGIPSAPMKSAAETWAVEVLGIERVHNLLRVSASTSAGANAPDEKSK